MANSSANDAPETPNLRLDTKGALASIGFGSIADADNASSEEEPAPTEPIRLDDAQTAIGVSISREQTRLTSPSTPAIEKAAAIEKSGSFFGGFDGNDDALVEEADEDENEDAVALESSAFESASKAAIYEEPSPVTSSGLPVSDGASQLPSPWRVNNAGQWETGDRPRSSIFDGLLNRKRASTGAESTLGASQKSLLSSLPLIPRNFSISSPFSSLYGKESEGTASRSDLAASTSSVVFSSADSKSQGSLATDTTPRPSLPTTTAVPIRPIDDNDSLRTTSISSTRDPLLRRSTSDQTLGVQRALSRVESLGDDSRFEDVHDQVNSRMKAIKDSWQDANIRLPGVSTVKVSSLTAESLRERMNKRQTLRSMSVAPDSTVSQYHPRPKDPMTRKPYSDMKSAVADAASEKSHPHPHFHRALENLEGDLVILGGYRGSVLRSAKPPHRQVWVPIKVGLNLRKVNLEVGFDEADDELATRRIIPDGMLTHIGPVDISRRLLKRLRACDNVRNGKLRVHEYGYDWRLMPRFLSKQLVQFLEGLPCNNDGVRRDRRGATVIAHSLGGLLTRHAVNQRPDLFAGVVYAGVPQTCVNILGPLRNGDEVLISNRVLTAQVNFSIRTSFALLPLDGHCFFDKETKEQYPVDFFDVNTWDELRLSPCVNRPLPPLQPPPRPTGIGSYVTSVANLLPSIPLPGRRDSERSIDATKVAAAQGVGTMNPTSSDATSSDPDQEMSARTAVTISRSQAMEYLRRTLANVKSFKEELAFDLRHADSNRYPPVAVIYGKSTPTVYGARVHGREGIKHADAYDDLAFASGDGVVLARAAMVPEGYKAARGGIVASDRGHVTLLGDLDAVGKCLNAVIRARGKGVGLGGLV